MVDLLKRVARMAVEMVHSQRIKTLIKEYYGQIEKRKSKGFSEAL